MRTEKTIGWDGAKQVSVWWVQGQYPVRTRSLNLQPPRRPGLLSSPFYTWEN